MALDPGTATLIASGISALGGLFGGGGGETQTPDRFQTGFQQLQLEDPSSQEALLASLSGQAAQQAFDVAGGGGPAGLSQQDILTGNLDAATRARLDETAFAGFDEALARAGRVSRARAAQTGLGGSSQESEFFGNVANPLISERAQLRASLMRDEILRRQQLRQALMANLLAVQQSPELMRLFQERLATGRNVFERESFPERPGGGGGSASAGGRGGRGGGVADPRATLVPNDPGVRAQNQAMVSSTDPNVNPNIINPDAAIITLDDGSVVQFDPTTGSFTG